MSNLKKINESIEKKVARDSSFSGKEKRKISRALSKSLKNLKNTNVYSSNSSKTVKKIASELKSDKNNQFVSDYIDAIKTVQKFNKPIK